MGLMDDFLEKMASEQEESLRDKYSPVTYNELFQEEYTKKTFKVGDKVKLLEKFATTVIPEPEVVCEVAVIIDPPIFRTEDGPLKVYDFGIAFRHTDGTIVTYPFDSKCFVKVG